MFLKRKVCDLFRNSTLTSVFINNKWIFTFTISWLFYLCIYWIHAYFTFMKKKRIFKLYLMIITYSNPVFRANRWYKPRVKMFFTLYRLNLNWFVNMCGVKHPKTGCSFFPPCVFLDVKYKHLEWGVRRIWEDRNQALLTFFVHLKATFISLNQTSNCTKVEKVGAWQMQSNFKTISGLVWLGGNCLSVRNTRILKEAASCHDVSESCSDSQIRVELSAAAFCISDPLAFNIAPTFWTIKWIL